MQTIHILEESILFAGLSETELDMLSAITCREKVKKGESIFYEGDKGRGFYIIATGKIKVYKISPSGKEQILHIFGRGEPFGEAAVFYGKPFPANAVALEKSELLFFPRTEFIDLLKRNESLTLNMLALLSKRLHQFAEQIENLSLKEVSARLKTYLLYLSQEQHNRELVTLDVSKGQLANLLGTTPETLSRIFAKLRDEGSISVENKTISLLDMKRLQ